MANEKYRYWLPDKDRNQELHCTDKNSVIIIGANGSGKSKLGAWIERCDFEGVHRIAAQRNLNFSEHVPLKSLKEAEDTVLYGGSDPSFRSNKGPKWGYGQHYTTKLMDDFDAVLAALIAQQNNENQRYVDECKAAKKTGGDMPALRESSLDKLLGIWDEVFPQRGLKMHDASFSAVIPETGVEYPATEMSDGERSVLYLAAQVLCVPEGKMLIMDEPEIHLHRSLTARLWRALERARQDCLFAYITHDIGFAAEHAGSDVVWVKDYDGQNWVCEQVPNSELPDELLLSLIGNRRPVLFVEGRPNGYDAQIYEALYPDFHVVPCGSCEQVKRNTRAYSETSGLNEIRAYGIIDRDYRSDEELEALEAKGVFALKVAEVENLLIVEPIMELAAERFASGDAEEVLSNVKRYVIEERFKPQLDGQVRAATVAALKSAMSGAEFFLGDESTVQNDFEDALRGIDPVGIWRALKGRFEGVAQSGDYGEVLALFSDKSAARSVGHFFGVDDKEYCGKVVRIIAEDPEGPFANALRGYVPELMGS